jgi:hypothetical protein
MRRPELAALAGGLALAAVLVAPAARAQQSSAEDVAWLRQRVIELEQRVIELEADDARELAAVSARPAQSSPVRVGGHGSFGWFNGQEDSTFDTPGFDVWDARLFFDAELARDVRFGESPIARDINLTFEWNVIRLGELFNDVGDLYVDFRELGGNRWVNAQAGRFQIPVGENYKRFGRGSSSNPFITNSAAGPWWWDEGLKLFGENEGGRFGYVASLTEGEGFFNENGDSDLQTTLKLFARPTEWLELSVSGLRSGELAASGGEEHGALWFGESWPMPLGEWTGVPNFQDGVAVPDGPREYSGMTLVGADAILHPIEHVRLWLAGGRVAMDAESSSVYDRDLLYWIAELVLEGRLAAPSLDPFYLALRANGLGTYDGDEGYLLDFRFGDSIGFNMESLQAWSIAAGWHLTDNVTLRSEYTLYRFDLVRGVTSEIRRAADRADFFGAALGVDF